MILGTAQDGGRPQVGCQGVCCEAARNDPDLVRFPVALGISGTDGSFHLVEASREMARQFDIWASKAEFTGTLSSLCLTHAHLGHVDGLGLFGREVMGVTGLITHCSSSMADLLRETPAWSELLQQGVLLPRVWSALTSFEPTNNCGFSITPISVPHRSELTDTHALLITGPERRLLFLPDIDSWDEVLEGRELKEWLSEMGVDIALIDGTFWDGGELPGRDMGEVPHPTVVDSLERLGRREQRDPEIHFLHLNHTNPLHDPDSEQALELTQKGWNTCEQGSLFEL